MMIDQDGRGGTIGSQGPLPHDERPAFPGLAMFIRLQPGLDGEAVARWIRQAVVERTQPTWLYVGGRTRDIGRRNKDSLTGGMQPLDFDLVVLVAARSEEERASVTDLALGSVGVHAALDGVLIVTGTQHLVRHGDWPLATVVLLRRRSVMTRRAFQHHWRTQHAAIAYGFPGGAGYWQLHTPPDGGDGPDGVALMLHPSKEQMTRGLEDSDFLEAIVTDERRFVDHAATSVLHFYDRTQGGLGPPTG